MVIWITGLQGAGKTTLANLLHQQLSLSQDNVFLLDGDALREVFSNKKYDRESRMELAMGYGKLSNLLSLQGATVICATVSMFHTVREWNAQHIEHYFEVYVQANIDVLNKRNQKGLYTQAASGKIENFHGYDIEIETPINPSLVIENNGNNTPIQLVNKIISELNLCRKN